MSGTELAGRRALVTGASRGIGKAIAQLLADRGASVAVNYRSNRNAAQETVAAIEKAGGEAIAVAGDVSRTADIRRMFEEAEAALGELDIVVANAGIALRRPAVDVTEEDFDAVFGTNARGAFFTMQEGARRVRDCGRIIAISAAGTRLFLPGMSLYLGSKGALEQFVRVFSRELAKRNVTVNAILPGFTRTEMMSAEAAEYGASLSPFKRVGSALEVAEAVAFLPSERAQWITGQNLGAGGGVS
ncbi:MAG: SDR family oxidoreductase [Acetobacteraceae bacterium]|nr:SDR family oxidoreductase [Acetobacteraceae bacterium]